MRNIFLLSGLILLNSNVFCQKIDNQVLRCQYKLTCVHDSSNAQKKSEDLMILELGKNCSKFYSYYTFLCDSLKNVDVKAGVPAMEILGKRAKYGQIRSTYTIYKNYPDNKITVVDKIGLDYYSFVEVLSPPKWVVKPVYDTILSYRCQKAVCNFKGRNYVAWFAKDIPATGGPWAFSGLPGLIMKIGDTRNHYLFQCVGILKSNNPIFYDKKEVFMVSEIEFFKTLRRCYDDPYGFLEGTNAVKISGGDRSARPYNPIDLSH